MKSKLKAVVYISIGISLILIYVFFYNFRVNNPKSMSNDFAPYDNRDTINYDSYVKESKAALLSQDYAKVISHLETIDQKYPEREKEKKMFEYAAMAYAYLMIGNYSESLKVTEKMVLVYPCYASKMMNFIALLRVGKTNESLIVLENIEKENKDNIRIQISVHCFRCMIYYALKTNQAGYREYERFVELFQLHIPNFEQVPEYYYMKSNISILSEHSTEYSLVLSKELPPPPKIDEDDPERVTFVFNVIYNITSNIDGSVVRSMTIDF